MSLTGQPPPSPALREALQFLADGDMARADEIVTKAAKVAKARHGSGSHPLAQAYADMGRLHYLSGEYKKAAAEFRHASDSPMPPTPAERADRLAFMFGFAGCLEALDLSADAEKVLRQCVVFARNLHGAASPGTAVALEPLARLLLRTGNTIEALMLLDEAYTTLWAHGHPGIVAVIPTRAEAVKAAGRTEDPFADLDHLPDALATEIVAAVLQRRGTGGDRTRLVLADALKYANRRFGDGHPTTTDALAAVAHHETALGSAGDPTIRDSAARRVLWGYAVQRVSADLLLNLEVRYEQGGELHLVPHLTRDPSPEEATQLESVLTEAVADLYARPTKGPTG